MNDDESSKNNNNNSSSGCYCCRRDPLHPRYCPSFSSSSTSAATGRNCHCNRPRSDTMECGGEGYSADCSSFSSSSSLEQQQHKQQQSMANIDTNNEKRHKQTKHVHHHHRNDGWSSEDVPTSRHGRRRRPTGTQQDRQQEQHAPTAATAAARLNCSLGPTKRPSNNSDTSASSSSSSNSSSTSSSCYSSNSNNNSSLCHRRPHNTNTDTQTPFWPNNRQQQPPPGSSSTQPPPHQQLSRMAPRDPRIDLSTVQTIPAAEFAYTTTITTSTNSTVPLLPTWTPILPNNNNTNTTTDATATSNAADDDGVAGAATGEADRLPPQQPLLLETESLPEDPEEVGRGGGGPTTTPNKSNGSISSSVPCLAPPRNQPSRNTNDEEHSAAAATRAGSTAVVVMPDTTRTTQSSGFQPRHPHSHNVRPCMDIAYENLMEAVIPFFQSQGISNLSSSSSSPAEASAISLRKEGSIQGPSGTRDKTNSTTSFMMQTRSSEKREGKEQMDVVASAAASDLGENEASSDSSSSMDNNTSSLSSSGENRQGKVYSQQKLLQHKQKTLLPLQLKHHGQQRDRNMPKLQAAGPSVPSHIVTDVSLSHLTGSSSSNNATTTSGGNTGSGSNTGGSSSNRGSSGSGNDGKGGGSSEEQQKEENSGDATNGSDGSSRDLVGSSARPVISGRADSALAKLHGNMGSMQATSHHQQQLHDPAKLRFTSFDSVVGDSAGVAFENRESKRWNKKRKRIEMRREYEAKQHMESSDSSDSSFNDDPVFKPGRPVTLDQVVVVSKIPMIVIQGSPPFLVVHTNAAFCRLTGIDSHHVVGKSISDLLFIPESSSNRCTRMHRAETFQHSESAEQMGGVVSGVSGYEDDQDLCNDAIGSHSEKCGNTPLERLIATCGFGHISIVHVFTKLDWLVGQQVTTVVKGGTMKRQHVDTRDQQSSHTVAGDNSALTDGTCTCRISIAPIISSDASVNSGMSIENKADSVVAKSHRGKPAVDHDPSRNSEAKGLVKLNNKYLPLQRVTHFVIQLHAEGEGFGKQNASMESLSSNSSSVEANLLGLSKQEMHLQKYTIGACRRQGDHSVPDEDIPTVDNNNNSDVYAAAEEGIEEDDVDLEAYSVTSEVDAVAAVG